MHCNANYFFHKENKVNGTTYDDLKIITSNINLSAGYNL